MGAELWEHNKIGEGLYVGEMWPWHEIDMKQLEVTKVKESNQTVK